VVERKFKNGDIVTPTSEEFLKFNKNLRGAKFRVEGPDPCWLRHERLILIESSYSNTFLGLSYIIQTDYLELVECSCQIETLMLKGCQCGGI
jgi:hypothetical protein